MLSSSSISYISSYFNFTYHVRFDGITIETTVTNQCNVADAWVEELRLVRTSGLNVVVGFHLKWDDWNNSTHSKCATLNLCTETKCLILQLSFINEITESLKKFLMNPRITFVGAHEDFTKIVCDYGLDCAKSEDIRAAVIKKWPRRFQRHDFEYLAKELASLKLDKPGDKLLTGWGNRVLDDTLVKYACIVAYASYKIGYAIFFESSSSFEYVYAPIYC